MNWKTRLVLWFGKWQKPLFAHAETDIHTMRKKAQQAAQLGSFLFDKKIESVKTKEVNLQNISLRIYDSQSASAEEKAVILYFHGGGFVLYNIDSHDFVCRRLCQMNNCIVVSVEYRLAPEYTFPVAHLDAEVALHWTLENISRYQGDNSKIIVAGDSAGGNLAACLAHYAKKNKLPLLGQILIYPWIDGKLNQPSIEKNGIGYLLTKESLFWFQKTYTPNPADRCVPELSPIYQADCSGLASCFILTASLDPLLDDGKNYFERLKKEGTVVQYKEYKNLFHGFFNTPLVARDALQAYVDIQKFIAALLCSNEDNLNF